MPRLWKIEEAAEELGVKPGSLKTAAREHGLLVKMGRTVRIDPEKLEELIKKCREKPKNQGSGSSAGTTTSATDKSPSQRAQKTAEKLKKLSPNTSSNGTGQALAQVRRIK